MGRADGHWSHRDWQLGGTRTSLGDITFDSTIHCGAGQGFEQVAPSHYRFRARAGLAPYAWRFHFCIESPGDGREVTLEVADFNHFGQELWREQATVRSTDGAHWEHLPLDRMRLVPWTPTGSPADDESIDDGWHPPYGVQYRLKLDAAKVWFATPTPYTLAHSRSHQLALAKRCDFFQVTELGPTAFSDVTGHGLLLTTAAKGTRHEGKIRVMVIAGEHPAESAGMYACEGMMEEVLRSSDLLGDFSFWFVPIVNVDGVGLGRTYHALDAADPLGPGTDLNKAWAERSQPEIQALVRLMDEVKPHCLLNLHNGRHRRTFEVVAPAQPHLTTLMERFREHLPFPLSHWREGRPGGAAYEALKRGAVDSALCFETLLLRRMDCCDTFMDSYRRVGIHLLRGLVAGLRDVHGRPHLKARSELLARSPLRCRAQDFVAQLPWFYYESFDSSQAHDVGSFEANGLPLEPGYYDVRLRMAPGHEQLQVRVAPGDSMGTRRSEGGWVVLRSVEVPARKVVFEFEQHDGHTPFDEALIAPEGTPQAAAEETAVAFEAYKRDIRAEERPCLRDWDAFALRLNRGGFGRDDLAAMRDEIVDWVAPRQVLDASDPHAGAVWSEEDKYDARDAAAAAACFALRHRDTGDGQWLDRSRLARTYAYRSQMHEPGNFRRHGGFVHMVQGIWGGNFTRLEPPYPGIDGVDTCVIVHQLARAAALGLPVGTEDIRAVHGAAEWIAHSEFLPGVFAHHEGATHDCQNSNSLGLSALVRAWHLLSGCGADAPGHWLEAVRRGLRHYSEGQEAIGVWPYIFASVGARGQAYHSANVPDHGIGLFHLTRVCHMEPLASWPGLHDMLKRAARWYLCTCRVDDDTIDLDYDRRPDLGNDICFSGFTWCRFTAAATLLRVARVTGEREPWVQLALRLMEHVRAKRWQTHDPDRAPVVAHARPEAKLATWCQTAEWDASMLGEMIEDLDALFTSA